MIISRKSVAILTILIITGFFLPVFAENNPQLSHTLLDIIVHNDSERGWVSFEFDQNQNKPAVRKTEQFFPDRVTITLINTKLGGNLREGLFYENLFSASDRSLSCVTIKPFDFPPQVRITLHLGMNLNSYFENFNQSVSRLVLTPDNLPYTQELRLLADHDADPISAEDIDEYIYKKVREDFNTAGSDIDKQLEKLKEITSSIDLQQPKHIFDSQGKYIIQVGDVLDIVVAGEPDFKAHNVKVRPDGYITYPYLGDVVAEGLTANELAMILKSRLVENFFNYEITLIVGLAEYTPSVVYLLGSIPQAGPVTYRKGMTVLDILGFFDHEKIDISNVSVIRKDEGRVDVNIREVLKGNIDLNIELLPNDYILLPSTEFIRVMVFGKIRLPGLYRVQADSKIYDAIGAAGGFAPRCDIRNIVIMRETDDGFEKIMVDLRKFTDDLDDSQNVALHERDIILVPEVNRPNWDKFIDDLHKFGIIWYNIDRTFD